MKKKIYYIAFLLIIAMNGCYTDTIDSFKSFTFQFPVNVYSIYINKAIPQVSKDFSNLYQYDEYFENRDRIEKAHILQVNYWIDTLVLAGNIPYDPELHELEFDYVKYTLIFARSKDGNIFSNDSSNFEPNYDIEEFALGTYYNVNVADFYRNPSHIIDIPNEVAEKISKQLKTEPFFYIVSEYSKLKGQTEDKIYFPMMNARFDVVIRFEVKL